MKIVRWWFRHATAKELWWFAFGVFLTTAVLTGAYLLSTL